MSTGWPAALAEGWHPVALLDELPRNAPLARTLMGVPLVLFAGKTGPAILHDACPHRGLPLSTGRLSGGALRCAYHGWQFGEDGRCLGLAGSTQVPAAAARRFPAVTRDGLLWTSLVADPPSFPSLPASLSDPARDGFWWSPGPSTARILDAVENLLDPAHPHFLHAGLVRSGRQRRPVRVTVTLGPDGAEAIYHEDARAQAWIPRLLEGHRLRSIGRYLPPATGQLAFEGPSGLELAITVMFSPEERDRTRPFAHFSTRKGLLPAWLKRTLLLALHHPVVAQDRRILALQAQSVDRLGGARFAVGPLDFLGPAIWRLANGEAQPEESYEVSVDL